ncbi:MAG TPA: response regulator transcription factor [Sulfuricurvum sp.]|nr:response regulator transcription factor [Sulfuricurvum sp.]
MNALIVIVEDDKDLMELLEYKLSKEGFEVIGLLNTKRLRQTLKEESVDMVIMDRNLPDVEGSEFIAMLRDQGLKTPVIFLSAKDTPKNVQEGFLSGGDDYITKPFEMQELVLRIKAVLHRCNPELDDRSDSNRLEYRDIVMQPQSHEVLVGEQRVELTRLEFNLLKTFIEHPNKVLQRDFLLKSVWGESGTHKGRTVNVAINRLKEKIDPGKDKAYIKTVRGIGYMIEKR